MHWCRSLMCWFRTLFSWWLRILPKMGGHLSRMVTGGIRLRLEARQHTWNPRLHLLPGFAKSQEPRLKVLQIGLPWGVIWWQFGGNAWADDVKGLLNSFRTFPFPFPFPLGFGEGESALLFLVAPLTMGIRQNCTSAWSAQVSKWASIGLDPSGCCARAPLVFSASFLNSILSASRSWCIVTGIAFGAGSFCKTSKIRSCQASMTVYLHSCATSKALALLLRAWRTRISPVTFASGLCVFAAIFTDPWLSKENFKSFWLWVISLLLLVNFSQGVHSKVWSCHLANRVDQLVARLSLRAEV